MKIILLGCPGAGKGTQARFICEKYVIPQISASDVIRAGLKSGEIDPEVRQAMQAGGLVPDSVVIGLIKNRISQPDCANGYLLDGFPRTIPQAEALVDAKVEIDHVIEISVTDETVVARLTGRRLHLASGRIYHIEFQPPKIDGKDDLTGEDLVQREDDREKTIRKRLEVYHQLTEPLCGFYREHSEKYAKPILHRINGDDTTENVTKQVFAILA